MIIDYGVGLAHYFGNFHVIHKAVRNLEEDLKTCCFTVMEIGDKGRIFSSLSTSYALPRSYFSIGSFYLCQPKVQSCKAAYLQLNVVKCGNLELASSPMFGLEKSVFPFLLPGEYIAAERFKIWVSFVFQIKFLWFLIHPTTVLVLINGVERVEPLAIISSLGLQGVKMRLAFGVKYIMISFYICYGAQTLFIFDELHAKETTPEYQTVAKSFNLMSFEYQDEFAHYFADDMQMDHPQEE
ncbi:hypothetical protein V6N11_069380 [Hibiscus sabdariffa]|uniref:Uncharacterized protein n=2 Tax=Hibiscus sabdariffa TaxID=183260 RepID=A0ABR1Z6A1_9ROSI